MRRVGRKGGGPVTRHGPAHLSRGGCQTWRMEPVHKAVLLILVIVLAIIVVTVALTGP